MPVVTVERARADGLTAKQIAYASLWNAAAAKMAKRRGQHADAKRHQSQADQLKAVAQALVG